MTAEYQLKQMLLHGEKMRTLQKKYFQEKDPALKKELLGQSKQAEREFDNLIFNVKQLAK